VTEARWGAWPERRVAKERGCAAGTLRARSGVPPNG